MSIVENIKGLSLDVSEIVVSGLPYIKKHFERSDYGTVES